jgi:hypothetical protein
MWQHCRLCFHLICPPAASQELTLMAIEHTFAASSFRCVTLYTVLLQHAAALVPRYIIEYQFLIMLNVVNMIKFGRTLNYLLLVILAITDTFMSGDNRKIDNEDRLIKYNETSSSRETKEIPYKICLLNSQILTIMEKRGNTIYFV